jgi:hypothetical protein
MDIDEFLKTIYVGDRGLKSINIDVWKGVVKFQLTSISRVRSDTWGYYSKEDIDDGYLVFDGVDGLSFEPSGVIPNDTVNGISAIQSIDGRANFLVVIHVDSVDLAGDRTEVKITIYADNMTLEDPLNPGIQIMR